MNLRAGMLSRGFSLSELAQLDCSVSLSSLRTVNLKAKEVLALCDPSLDPVSDMEGFISFWQRVRALVADPACLEPKMRWLLPMGSSLGLPVEECGKRDRE
jgi:hypothetical protein